MVDQTERGGEEMRQRDGLKPGLAALGRMWWLPAQRTQRNGRPMSL